MVPPRPTGARQFDAQVATSLLRFIVTNDPLVTSNPSATRGLFSDQATLRAAILAGGLLAAFWIVRFSIGHDAASPLAWASLAIGMLYGGRAAWESLREKRFDIDVLMVLAAALAAWTGHPEDGALLLFLFVLSGALEARAMGRARRAVEVLGKLIPDQAIAWRGEPGAEQWQSVGADSLRPGDRVQLRTGDRIAADGVLTQGRTSLDQSSLTGESLPREARDGEPVYAGTINVGHPVEMRITKPASESGIQRILHMVTQAQEQREPVQRFIDRLGQPYAIAVVLASTAVLLLWRYALGRAWLETPGNAVDAATALMIVMSPCALVIATPTATLAAIGRAAREGVLFKGGQATERLARLNALCVDKTGTLTVGRPSLASIMPAPGADDSTLLAAAAAMEEGSTHPIAVAIRAAARERALTLPDAKAVRYVPGQGLAASIEDSEAVLGTLELAAPHLDEPTQRSIESALANARNDGHIAVVFAWKRGLAAHAGVIALADPLRASTPAAIQELHDLGVNPVVMLTGDHEGTARRIAREAGVDEWHASLLPEDKVTHLRRIASDAKATNPKHAVGVMGDGVNDAPSLAYADVSIAIGSIGSDAAMESADTVLITDNLRAVPWALRLARDTRRTILINITFALSIIGVMAIVAIVASLLKRDLPLPLAVVAHEGGTLLVVLHSLRLTLRAGLARELPISTQREPDRPGLRADATIQPTKG